MRRPRKRHGALPTADERRAAQDAIAERGGAALLTVLDDATRHAAAAFRMTGQVTVPDDHRQRVEGALLSIWRASVQQAGRSMIDEFKDLMPVETKAGEESLFDQILSAFAEVFGGRKVTMVSDTTRDQISRIAARGQREGMSLAEIGGLIEKIGPDFNGTRAAVIARTETHGSSGYATQQVARTSRRPLLKQWGATEDHRTRDFGEGDGVVDEYSHRAMDGVKIPMDQPYRVPMKYGGEALLMYPGDPSGPAGAIINCRCVETYVRPE